MTFPNLILAGLVAVVAGAVNALAGGGTLITFPTLIFLGMPSIDANITNTVALCPGYVGGMFAQRGDLMGQRRRLLLFVTAGITGGVAGGLLLLHTRERMFDLLVPFLILFASVLLMVQAPVRRWLAQRSGTAFGLRPSRLLSTALMTLAAIYGGYFGAGLSVIVLAVMGLTEEDSLTRLNAAKQAISFAVNGSVAVYFLFSGRVAWTVAFVMAAGALAGGTLGGSLASRIHPDSLRRTVVCAGIIMAIVYWIR